jgi:hypothetical protein
MRSDRPSMDNRRESWNKVKVKSLCLIKQAAPRGKCRQLHSFRTLGIWRWVSGKLHVPAALLLGKYLPNTNLIGPRAGLDELAKRETAPGIEPRFFVVQVALTSHPTVTAWGLENWRSRKSKRRVNVTEAGPGRGIMQRHDEFRKDTCISADLCRWAGSGPVGGTHWHRHRELGHVYNWRTSPMIHFWGGKWRGCKKLIFLCSCVRDRPG